MTFPPAWRAVLEDRVAFYRTLRDATKYEARVAAFVRARVFKGARKLVVTEEMKVVVAAAAARLTLAMPWERFARVTVVNLYPDRIRMETIGTCSDRSISVSWPSLVDGMADPHDGENVGYHELAHALDLTDGTFDGQPLLPPGAMSIDWGQIIAHARQYLQECIDDDREIPMDAYGAESDSELFAVATEAFFETPRRLREHLPELHGLLAGYYRQQPDEEA
jgi:Mlc titration factor MtfA (ptsG expression regulator)